jgi:hypothetical protein
LFLIAGLKVTQSLIIPVSADDTPQLLGLTPQLLGLTPQLLGLTPQLLGLTPQLLGLTPQCIDYIKEKHAINILNN